MSYIPAFRFPATLLAGIYTGVFVAVVAVILALAEKFAKPSQKEIEEMRLQRKLEDERRDHSSPPVKIP